MLGLYMQALFDLFRKFMIILGQPLIPMLIQGLTLPVHIFLCYMLTSRGGLGVQGVALATNFTFLLNFMMICVAIFFFKHIRQCLVPVDQQTFKRLWSYFLLGLPTAMMVCLDMWCFSFLTLIAHYLGVTENAGQVILLNVLCLLYAIPMGFSSGSCALVGNNIGKGKVENAKMYAKQAIFLVMVVSLIPCICFATMPRQIASIFTNDEKIIDTCLLALTISAIGF